MKRRNFLETIFAGFAVAIFPIFKQSKTERVPNVERLRGLSAEPGEILKTDGYYEPGDGGAGIFKFSDAGSPDNEGKKFIIVPDEKDGDAVFTTTGWIKDSADGCSYKLEFLK